MKRLHLIRHAKSTWDDPSLSDIERPLNKRGLKATETMAQPILAAGCDFDAVYCSAAVRAQETIENIAAHLPDQDISWQVDRSLYTFNAGDLLDWCRELDEGLSEVTVIGHNPAITEFTNRMTNSSILNVPTCGYLQIVLTTDWAGLDAGTANLFAFLTPKMLSE